MRFSEFPLTTRLITSLLSAIIIATSSFISPAYALPEQTTLTFFEDQIRAQTGNYDISNEQIIQQVESLQDKATRIAQDHKISVSTLFNLVSSESDWISDAKGDHGCSYGLAQINICAHKEIDKVDALDPDFALNYAAKAISEGTEDAWSVCNCYSFIQANYIKNLPRMAEIQPNTSVPHKGFVAIFYYPDKKTGKIIKHIAYTLDDQGTIKQANKTHCLVDTQVINKLSPYFAGYWDPSAS